VRALQQFVGEGGWDDAVILAAHQRLVDETLGEEDGVLLIDGSDLPKQGNHSAGVARQWCGAPTPAGRPCKRDNCQAGVYLGYASRQGYTLLDRRLYLPACWFTPEYQERWDACRIPADTPFQTKPALAAGMVEQLQAERRVRARWLACDEGYGQDRVPTEWVFPGSGGRQRPVVSGGGTAQHVRLAVGRPHRWDDAASASHDRSAPGDVGTRTPAQQGTAAAGQPSLAAGGGAGRPAGRAVASLPPPGRQQRTVGGGVRRRAGRGRAGRVARPRRLGAAASPVAGPRPDAGGQVLP